MKSHLHKVERRIDYTNKSEYDFILNQSERSQSIPQSYYTKFIKSLSQHQKNMRLMTKRTNHRKGSK